MYCFQLVSVTSTVGRLARFIHLIKTVETRRNLYGRKTRGNCCAFANSPVSLQEDGSTDERFCPANWRSFGHDANHRGWPCDVDETGKVREKKTKINRTVRRTRAIGSPIRTIAAPEHKSICRRRTAELSRVSPQRFQPIPRIVIVTLPNGARRGLRGLSERRPRLGKSREGTGDGTENLR